MTAPPAGALEACLALLEKAKFGQLSVSGTGFLLEDRHMVGDGVYGEAAPAIAAAVNFLRTHGPALLAALRLREGWMPEESAPKDGAKFLALTHFGDIEINQWCSMGNFRWEHVEGNTYRKVEEAPSEFWNGNSFTHWMPLPAPPTADDLARILEEGE